MNLKERYVDMQAFYTLVTRIHNKRHVSQVFKFFIFVDQNPPVLNRIVGLNNTRGQAGILIIQGVKLISGEVLLSVGK